MAQHDPSEAPSTPAVSQVAPRVDDASQSRVFKAPPRAHRIGRPATAAPAPVRSASKP